MLPVILATTLLLTVNTAIANVALADIRVALGFTPASLSWVINAYLLAYGGLLIAGGRLGDVFGRRRILLIGLGVFTLASLLAGAAGNPSLLIGARAAQGLGAALAAPAVLAIITHRWEGHARARVLSWFSVVLGAGLSLGMIVGGLALQLLGWRWVFWINVPLGILLFLLTLLLVEPMRSHERVRLDLLGAALTTLTAVGVVVAFVELANTHRFGVLAIVSLVVAVGSVIGLVFRLRHANAPLIPPALFASRSTVGAILVNALQPAAMTSLVFFLSQALGGPFGLGPLAVGATFLVFTLPQMATAFSSARLMRVFGVHPVLAVGLLLSAIGLVLLAVAAPADSIGPLLIVAMIVTGLGAGGIYLGVNITIMSNVEPAFAGAASGLVQTSVQLGGSVGVAIAVLVSSLTDESGAYLTAAAFLLIGIAASFFRDREGNAVPARAS
jgi:MFS family permease